MSFRKLVLMVLVAAVAACFDSTGPRMVSEVQIRAEAARVEVGDSLRVNATAVDAQGTEVETVQIAWSVADASVAAVEGDGWVVGKAPGRTLVYADAGGARGELEIEVLAAPIHSLRVTPDTVTVALAGTTRLIATAHDDDGAELTGRALVWASDDETIATVDTAGTVTARDLGEATITVRGEGKTASARVRVVLPALGDLRAELVGTGFLPMPTHVASAPGDSRLFVVERDGQIRVVEGGRLLDEPFLDIRDRISAEGESGLFSVAFHPSFASNGHFYVNFDEGGELRVVRFTASADRKRADPASAKPIIAAGYAGFHFGGVVEFGPDRKLYIATGEGGDGMRSQDKGSLFGKILRIDVDAGDPYAIPADNPFVGQPGARGEVWAMGLRNPWRMSIDHRAGVMYIADVGGTHWEEINVAKLSTGGLNFGWPHMEGALCQPESRTDCVREGLTLPLVSYPHGERGTGHPYGCSVTGGSVYRGTLVPGLWGHYFYGDFCQSWVRSFRYVDGKITDARQWQFSGVGGLVSFGQDSRGELYMASKAGSVHAIRPAN